MLVQPNRSYLPAILAAFTALALAGLVAGSVGRDHFAAIRDGRGPDWYRDLGGSSITEIQNQDLLYRGIGGSAASARSADVVFVGSSLVAFALDEQVLRRELTERHGLTFFDLSFVGISSGEFTRRVLRRNGIRPRLLLINADDGGGGGTFFGTGVVRSFGADVQPIGALGRSRFRAWQEVARRNLLWRLQALVRGAAHLVGIEPVRPPSAAFARNARDGRYDMRDVHRFRAPDNPASPTARDPDCHASPAAIDVARAWIKPMSDVVLFLVPNVHYCAQQAQEIASALGNETAITGRLDYASWDGGGHLDARGAAAFTRDLVSALERTDTFRRITAEAARARAAPGG